jgi:excinuclease ABC subunit C
MSPDELQQKVSSLPDAPGVYQFMNEKGRVIYIGKAKSLRKRVSSYFRKTQHESERTRRLVEEIRDLDVLLTKTEVEALILEQSLVRKTKPRWNVLLRDDKSHLYLHLTTTDPFPGLYLVRRPRKDGDRYFGPFLPPSAARKTLRLLTKNFQLRVCQGDVKQQNYRACLYYQIHQCLAPCVDMVPEEEYAGAVKNAIQFLEGRDRELLRDLGEKMEAASAGERYERAAYYRDLIRMVERLWEKQRIASTSLEDQDVFGLHREGPKAVLHVWNVRRGVVQGRGEFAWENLLDLGDAELVSMAVGQYYTRIEVVPAEVVLPLEPPDRELLEAWLGEKRDGKVRIVRPQRGSKRDRLELVMGDAKLGFEKRFRWTARPVEELQEALGLPAPPKRIEAFDISNIQGADVVASMVSFRGGKPRKSEYRKYRIRTVEGLPDDFASMAEVVGRRYRRVLQEGGKLPDLILIDGGKGQLSSAVRTLEELGQPEQPIASLAKEEELLFVRDRDEPVRLPRDSAALQLVQRVRDEAHRVAVTFHRKRRSQRALTSVLEHIPGIGPKRSKELLRRFGSIKGIQEASREELTDAVGAKAAAAIIESLRGGPPADAAG